MSKGTAMLTRLRNSFTENLPAASIALITFCLSLATNLLGGYGYFRDEFYYLACSDHLDWGYVDHPPLSILFLWLNRMLLGDSIFALRLLPALAGSVVVYLTGLIVREFRGGKPAQLFACLAVGVAPVYLAVNGFYSMNAFESLTWMSATYIVIRIINTENQKLWILFGLIAGLGLQNKHSMLFFGFALIVGLLLTEQRKQFRSKWFWLGGLLASLLFLPNILWQAGNEWPTLEFMQNAQQWKNAPMSPLGFMSAQILFQHPAALPLWLAGLLAFFFHSELKKYRLFGVAFLTLLILFVVQRGKPYYLSPVYPVILGAGAILFEEFIHRKNWKWFVPSYGAILTVSGLALLPMFVPVLPVETYIRYARAIGLPMPKMERHGDTVLPQVLADRFGWKEMVAEVASAYNSLSPEEKAAAAIYTQNYGEAGAVDFFGAALELPKAISGHNSYWNWGTRGYSGEVLIVIGGKAEDHSKVYESVELVVTHRNAYAMPYETELPIFICRKPKVSLAHLWIKAKHYI